VISGAIAPPKRRSFHAKLEELEAVIAMRPKSDVTEIDDDVSIPSDPSEMFRIMTGHVPDPWQSEYLVRTDSSPCSRQRNLLLTARQVGKSTVVGVRCARRLLKWKGQQVVTVSKTETQAKLLSRRIARGVARWVPRGSWLCDNISEIELPNGNTMYTLPGGNPEGIRGFSPTLLVLDEAAFVPEELIAALSPMLARTKGDWDMLSSANGPAGTFYEAAEGEQKGDWSQITVTAEQCKAYDQEFLESEKRRLGDARFMREFFCKFTSPEGAFFSLQSIDALLEGDMWAAAKGRDGKRPDLGEQWDYDDLDEALDLTKHADRKLDKILEKPWDKARFYD
jgi:hypothetical protein